MIFQEAQLREVLLDSSQPLVVRVRGLEIAVYLWIRGFGSQQIQQRKQLDAVQHGHLRVAGHVLALPHLRQVARAIDRVFVRPCIVVCKRVR